MNKMFGYRKRKSPEHQRMPQSDEEESRQGEPLKNYEGREHVRYKDPGHSSHEIHYPGDEPHMKSHVGSDEEHEAEDDYHKDTFPHESRSMPAHLKRAHMKMDQPDQEEPDELQGNLYRNVGAGIEDTSGEQMEGPNQMQQGGSSKENRKKMIIAVVKKKMKKNEGPGFPGSQNFSTVRSSY